MAERQLSKVERKREKQPISVPFIWEVKPGTPKKDWKPSPKPIPANPVSPPVKLVVSVPFGWEEKPGTPLQSAAVVPPYRSSEANTAFDHGLADDQPNNGSSLLSDSSELDTCSFKTSDSFSSAMSSNSIITETTELSRTVPFEMGSKRWVGASFLEWMFPLLVVPGSSLQDEVESGEEKGVISDQQVQELKLDEGGRPLLTLGELIVMSRRRSIQKKIVKMKKHPSLDFMRGNNGFGCCVFGATMDGFVGLHKKWKKHLQLRLM